MIHQYYNYLNILNSYLGTPVNSWTIDAMESPLTMEVTTVLSWSVKHRLIDRNNKRDLIDGTLTALSNDLFAFKPVREKIESLEKEIDNLKKQLETTKEAGIEMSKYKTYYDLQYKINHGKQNE